MSDETLVVRTDDVQFVFLDIGLYWAAIADPVPNPDPMPRGQPQSPACKAWEKRNRVRRA